MKRFDYILGLILSLGTIQFANATIHTVDNNPDAPGGVFSTIQLAVDAASNGDSIYVVGSASLYAPFVAAKELHIFGAGHFPDKQNPHPTTISGNSNFTVTVSGTTVTGDASGSTLQGLKMDKIILTGNSDTYRLSDITLSRCNFYLNGIQFGSYVENVLIRNNRANSISGDNYLNNIIVANNVFANFYLNGNALTSSSILVSNNLFQGNGALGAVIGILFSNNIFYGFSPYNSNQESCTFNNNISYSSSNDLFNVSGTNSGGGNFESVDPQFISISGVNYASTDDYNLQPTSPGINAGTDGTDIGIYGAAYPWPDGGISGGGFMYSQEADIPQTNQMNVQNAVVPLNGTLNLTVKGITNH